MRRRCYVYGEPGYLARNCSSRRTLGYSSPTPSATTQRSVPQQMKARNEQREGRVFALVPREGTSSDTMAGTLFICTTPGFLVMDSRSTHLYVSSHFTRNLDVIAKPLGCDLSVHSLIGKQIVSS